MARRKEEEKKWKKIDESSDEDGHLWGVCGRLSESWAERWRDSAMEERRDSHAETTEQQVRMDS